MNKPFILKLDQVLDCFIIIVPQNTRQHKGFRFAESQLKTSLVTNNTLVWLQNSQSTIALPSHIFVYQQSL